MSLLTINSGEFRDLAAQCTFMLKHCWSIKYDGENMDVNQSRPKQVTCTIPPKTEGNYQEWVESV